MDGECSQTKLAYPPLAALIKDAEACDTELELHLKLKDKDNWEELQKQLAAMKLALGVAKTAKGKQGLVRELKTKLTKAEILSSIPPALLARLNTV